MPRAPSRRPFAVPIDRDRAHWHARYLVSKSPAGKLAPGDTAPTRRFPGDAMAGC